jgi:hypothetical protein
VAPLQHIKLNYTEILTVQIRGDDDEGIVFSEYTHLYRHKVLHFGDFDK